ncbi:hypothetical protein ACLMAJ_00940 [Nocardia sp. KC 131]
MLNAIDDRTAVRRLIELVTKDLHIAWARTDVHRFFTTGVTAGEFDQPHA